MTECFVSLHSLPVYKAKPGQEIVLVLMEFTKEFTYQICHLRHTITVITGKVATLKAFSLKEKFHN